VLIAAATKNDAGLVSEALARNDLLLPADRIDPVEAHWGPKSASVARILAAWNVGGDSVAFVDDSAMERAEVAATHSGLLCLAFPERDDASLVGFLERVRDLFGKPRVLDEDGLRRDSLRSARAVREAAGDSAEASDRFLEQAEAHLEFHLAADPSDGRALELVNKTNQFNLNGRRFSEAAWREALARPGAFLLTAAYADKYGPLGKIAVVAGRRDESGVQVEVFVLSCRAFSRRIEHRCLERLFAGFDAQQIALDFAPTPRNGPARDFLAGLLGRAPESPARLRLEDFAARCPPLHHEVKES
jgi:FkbH-like protein